MVTAKEAEFDKVRALEAGADDYITKPFGMMEFIARVKAVLRRSSRHGDDRELSCEELRIFYQAVIRCIVMISLWSLPARNLNFFCILWKTEESL